MEIKYENKHYTAEWLDTYFNGKKLIISDLSDKIVAKKRFTYTQWLFQHESPYTYKKILDEVFHPKRFFSESPEFLDLDNIK